MKLIVYDCEIANAIPQASMVPIMGMKYCAGWTDYTGMGISVIGAYVWGEGYRVFLEDNIGEFAAIAASPETILVGFNNKSFDDRLIAACLPVNLPNSWDLLCEVRRAKGMNPDAPGGSTGGLDGLARANFLPGKKNTANSPILWQQGRRGQVIDQCLNDVMLTKKLTEAALSSSLRDPSTGRKLAINIDLLKMAVDQVDV